MVNHYEKVYHNGKLVSKTKVSQEIERRTKDKIIAVGTKSGEACHRSGGSHRCKGETG